MYLASNLKYLRSKRKLTQSDLAAKLDKTSAAISDYEKGKSLPPLDVAFRISQIFQVNIDDLVGKDLRKEDILANEGLQTDTETSYRRRYEQLQQDLQTQKQLTQLQQHRLTELEREIRERAPELARRLGL